MPEPDRHPIPPSLAIDTPRGVARAHLHRPTGPPTALVVLLHGAGTDTGRQPLPVLADELALAGALAVRFDQPYVVAARRATPGGGVVDRRAPAPATQLDEALLAALPALRALAPGAPLGMVGRSSGARVACRTAAAAGTSAIAALGFPWRTPGKPADRGADLRVGAAACPVLVVQGERDPFGRPTRTRGVRVHVVAGMAHTPTEPAARFAGRWLVRRLRQDPDGNSPVARVR